MSLIIANILGFVVLHKRAILIGVGILILLLLVIGIYRGCGKAPAKLDEKAIQQAQQAIAEQDRAKQIEILARSDAQEKAADDIAANAKANRINAEQESKAKWQTATDEEITKELERRLNGE